MTDCKWTPGPWGIVNEGAKWIWIGPKSWRIRCCRVVIYDGDEEECLANANLMTSAPRLYEALQSFVDSLPKLNMSDPCMVERVARAKEALSEARGEQ